MNITLKPHYDYIIVVKDRPPKEKISDAGIIQPVAYVPEEVYCTGTVFALGPNTQNLKLDERVLFPRHAGLEVNYGGNIVTIMREVEIIASIV